MKKEIHFDFNMPNAILPMKGVLELTNDAFDRGLWQRVTEISNANSDADTAEFFTTHVHRWLVPEWGLEFSGSEAFTRLPRIAIFSALVAVERWLKANEGL